MSGIRFGSCSRSLLNCTPGLSCGRANQNAGLVHLEADRLSNMDGSGLDPEKRIPVESSDLSWHILENALRLGAQLQRVRDARGSIETVSRTLGEVKFLHTAGCRTNPKGGGTEVLCKYRKSDKLGCRVASDLLLWTYIWRRVRRLRSLLSRVMGSVRPRFPHRCVPKSVAETDGRFTGGAQRCGSLGGAPGRNDALRDVHDGCGRCSPGLWLLTGRLLLTCSLWLDNSRYPWEAASNMTTEVWLRDLVLKAIVASPLSPRDADFWKEHLVGRLARKRTLSTAGGRRTASRERSIGPSYRFSLTWLVIPSVSRWDFSMQDYCLAWGFVYRARAGSSSERSSCAGSSSPRTRGLRRAVERNWCSRTITRPRWNQWLASDGWRRQSSSWRVFRDGT